MVTRLALLIGVTAIQCVLTAAGEAASNHFDVRAFGAAGDSTTDDTEAVQQALDTCASAGGGVVILSPGTYRCRPIVLRSDTTLRLEAGATLKGSPVTTDYHRPDKPFPATSSSAFYPLVSAKKASRVALVGNGTIDGSGEAWWPAARIAKQTNPTNSGYTLPRPRMVHFEDCTDVRVEGITLINSPSFHLVPKRCRNVVIDGVTIRAPDEAPNTDGIDPSECVNVRISNCLIDVGDDNIAIKSGKRSPTREFASENIVITDCLFRGGHGLSIGSETAGGVRNMRVERCRFEGTENGLRIKSKRGRGGRIEALMFRDIVMVDVDPAITFTCYYPKIPKLDEARPITDTTPMYSNLVISNLTASCLHEAGSIVGLPESPIDGLTLVNVNITSETGLRIQNATGVRLQEVEVRTQQGPSLLLQDADVEDEPRVHEALGTDR